MKTAIITGITGQDGAYLSQLLLKKGYRVVGFVRNCKKSSLTKLAYLGIRDQIVFEECNLLDLSNIIKINKKIRARRDLQPRCPELCQGILRSADRDD